MIKKTYRLTSKDINYIFKKQVFINSSYFTFFSVPQYKNKNFNQFAVQISTKISKNAVDRNFIRRICYEEVRTSVFSDKGTKFYKIFCFVNKKGQELIKQAIETQEKKLIKKLIKDNFSKDFNYIKRKLGI